MRVRIKNLHSAWGYFYKGAIVLHKALKPYPIPSKQSVLKHEECHKWISDNRIEISAAKEEKVCFIYAILNIKSNNLTYIEELYKRYLIKTYGKIGIRKLIDYVKRNII